MKKGLILGLLLLGVLLVGAFWLGKHTTNTTSANTKDTSSLYPLLAKRIFVDNPNEPIINFTGLRSSLKEYFQDNNLTGSLYFEYLPTGTSIRVDGDNKQIAASLAKLPIAMVLYKSAELGKLDLDKKVTLKQEWLDNSYGTLYQKGVGYELTLREAAKIMLTESDNTALSAITASLEGIVTEEENPFSFLDADYQQNADQTVSIGARSYSSFLKCLYFSCYLEEQNSQDILNYLVQSKFNSRLVAGVGSGVDVAHKIGTFSNTTQSDCGIIYFEKKNYILCAMIEGPNNETTDNHIAELSRMTYNYIDKIKYKR